jgi:RNA polymerase sigma-70 factor (ECF subfamily)
MTVTTPMSLFIREQTAAADAASGSATPSGADAEARRLAAAVARGDETAFRELYDAYQPRLFRFALVLGRGDDALAGETVQSVFLTAASKLRPVAGEDHLWHWLARVARQHLAKHWRRQRRESAVISMAEPPPGADPGESDGRLEASLDAALLELDPDERQIIEQFYLEGRSQKEMAEQLNLTPKAVSSRLERARAKLRVLVAKQLSHES